jgi:thiol-disulfide isomerase/thioredoxin
MLLRELAPLMHEIDGLSQRGAIGEAIASGESERWIAITNRAIELVRQLPATNPKFVDFAKHVERRFTTVLAAFDDPATIKLLADRSDPPKAPLNNAIALGGRWLKTTVNDPARDQIIEDFQKAAQDSSPANESLAQVLRDVQNGQLSPEERSRIEQIVLTDLRDTTVARDMTEHKQAEARFLAMKDQPLALAGPLVDGTEFSSDQWKGKVILVDFWATWCGPCLQELPRVKDAYAKFHEQGLEVLGVSCDESADALTKFLADNPDMPWPQLFDASKPGWHPLARHYGVQGIPTMLLIDKKGVVRSTNAREDFEDQIPKLLAE